MSFNRLLALTCTALALTYVAAHLSNGALAQLQVPARALPVPTDVSPEMQRIIAAPRNPSWNVLWKTGEEWRAAANTQAAKTVQTLPAMRERLHVTTQPGTIGGVRVFTVASDTIPPEHRNKLLLH